MGKGNRSRQDRAFEAVNTTTEATPKSTKFKTTIATIVVAAVLVCCIVLSLVVNTGIILRTQTASKTNNYSVNGTIMSYLIYSQAQSMAAMYQQYGLNYGVSDILKMSYGGSNSGKTYFDYFAESAYAQVKQMLILCEYADANGIKLSDDDKAEIKEYMDALAKTASDNFYTLNGYLKLMYGNGVTGNDIRKVLELNYLSNAAYKQLKEKLEGQITDDMINKYLEEHIDQFYTVDYLTYTFTAKLEAEKAEATDEEKAAYEQSKKDMLALAEKLGEITSEEAFKEFVRDYLVNTVASKSFDSTYEKDYMVKLDKAGVKPTDEKLAADKAALLEKLDAALKELDVEDDEKEEEDKKEEDKKEEEDKRNDYEKALDKIYSSLLTTATKAYTAVNVDEYYHYDPETEKDKISELDKWLFDEKTKANDTKLIKDEGNKTSTYKVYLLKTTSHIDESETKDVAHLLVSFNDYKEGTKITDEEKAKAKAEAEKLLAEYLEGEKTQEAFEKFAEEHTADSAVTYENVKKGQMVEEFEDWIFDEARKIGDTDIVETEYGYHVMYFVGEGKIAWKADAFSGVLSDLFEDWIEENSKTYGFSANESAISTLR